MNKTDYILQDAEAKDAPSFSERELKGADSVFIYSSSLSGITEDGTPRQFETVKSDNAAIFTQNLRYWNQQTGFMSVNNFDNEYFKQIVDMGLDAVPFIVEELKKGPSLLVHALDLILPGVVKYEGSVSLKDACDTWLSILN